MLKINLIVLFFGLIVLTSCKDKNAQDQSSVVSDVVQQETNKIDAQKVLNADDDGVAINDTANISVSVPASATIISPAHSTINTPTVSQAMVDLTNAVKSKDKTVKLNKAVDALSTTTDKTLEELKNKIDENAQTLASNAKPAIDTLSEPSEKSLEELKNKIDQNAQTLLVSDARPAVTAK